MLASTRLPMPAVSVSDRFWVKVAWIENFAAPEDNLASAESTLVSEVWMVLIRAEALAWVEIEAAAEISTTGPERLIFWASVVTWRDPSDEAKAVIIWVEPLTRLEPLNVALLTMVVIWPKRAWKLAFKASRLAVSSEESDAERACCFNWIKRSEIDWPADSAT